MSLAREASASLAFQLSRPGSGYQLRHAEPQRFVLTGQDGLLFLDDAASLSGPELEAQLRRTLAKLPPGRVTFVLCHAAQSAELAEIARRFDRSAPWRRQRVAVVLMDGQSGACQREGGRGRIQEPLRAAAMAYRGGTRAPAAPLDAPDWTLEARGRAVHAEQAEAARFRAVIERPLIAVPALIGACILVYLGQLWSGTAESIPTLVAFGANVRELVVAGEVWRLGAATFVHGGMYHLHIIFNLYALWVLGRFHERLVGIRIFTVVYAVSGIGASLASVLTLGIPSVGASGAIFGVFGLHAAVAWRPRGLLPPRVGRALLRNVFVLLALNLGIGLAVPQIDNAAHMGGLALGVILGLGLPLGREQSGSARGLTLAALLAAAILVGAFGASVYHGAMHVAGRDLGQPVPVEAGPVRLALPADLAANATQLDGQATFYAPYGAIEVRITWRGDRIVALHRMTPRPDPSAAPIADGWRIYTTSYEQRDFKIYALFARPEAAERSLEVRIDVTADQRDRYRPVIDAIFRSLTGPVF